VIILIAIPKFEIFQKLMDKINLLTRENLTGIRVIRALNREDFEEKKFVKANNELTKTDLSIVKVMQLQTPIMLLIFNGTSLLAIWVGIARLGMDISYLGKMMAFMQYATQVIMSFLFLTMLFVMVPRANVSAKRINEVLMTESEIQFPEEMTEEPTVKASVEFRHVDFRYGKSMGDVLCREIPYGSFVASRCIGREDVNRQMIILMNRWLVFRPKVLVVGHPFKNCDTYGVYLMKAFLKRFTEIGTAVILVSSDPEYCESVADWIDFIDDFDKRGFISAFGGKEFSC